MAAILDESRIITPWESLRCAGAFGCVPMPTSLSQAKILRLSQSDLLKAFDDWGISYSADDLDLELRGRLARAVANADKAALSGSLYKHPAFDRSDKGSGQGPRRRAVRCKALHLQVPASVLLKWFRVVCPHVGRDWEDVSGLSRRPRAVQKTNQACELQTG